MTAILHSTLGHYRILEKIGEGGMGEVYRARDQHLERDVAIKVLPAGLLGDDLVRSHFHKEALALSKLNHPNIEIVYDFDRQDGLDFLVMEFIPGTTLSEKIEIGPLPEADIVRLGLQLAEGLAAAHGHGVVHCDLKPANLRITPEGQLKILDFGVAKLVRPAGVTSQQETSTQTWPVAGTPSYMAPEQLRGERVDARTDIYAAGVVLYEMTTGRRPFSERSSADLLDRILHQPAVPPVQLRPGLSKRFQSVILKCLEKEPAHRYQSAKELHAGLRPLETATPAPPATRRTRNWVAATSGIALLALLSLFLITDVGHLRRRFQGNSVQEGAPSSPVTSEISDLVKRSSPGIVLVEVKEKDGKAVVLGSGFVADPSGLVVSSLHVFEKAASAKVKVEGGAEFGDPLVVGFDRERDLIAIRVRAPALRFLPVDRSGSSQAGEKIVVIGNPAGLSGTVSDGIISSVRETEKGTLYQITAPVSPGSSGGPVLNMKGEVIGIIAFSLRSGQNLNFAVPVRYVLPLLERPDSMTFAQFSSRLAGADSARRSPPTAAEEYRLGLDLYSKQKPREAIDAFKRAIDLDPRHAESYFQMGSILAGEPHSRDQAIGYLREGLKISPEDSVAHSLLALLYRQDHRYSDSIEESKKAIAVSPLNPAFHLVLAITFEENQRYEEAIAEAKEAIHLRRNYATAHYHLAMSQEKVGNLQAAEQSWRAFLRTTGSRDSDQIRIAREHLAHLQPQR